MPREPAKASPLNSAPLGETPTTKISPGTVLMPSKLVKTAWSWGSAAAGAANNGMANRAAMALVTSVRVMEGPPTQPRASGPAASSWPGCEFRSSKANSPRTLRSLSQVGFFFWGVSGGFCGGGARSAWKTVATAAVKVAGRQPNAHRHARPPLVNPCLEALQAPGPLDSVKGVISLQGCGDAVLVAPVRRLGHRNSRPVQTLVYRQELRTTLPRNCRSDASLPGGVVRTGL